MSVVNRIVLAGLISAAMGAQAVAAPTADDPGSTKGRLAHASKCVVTFGFGGGCDKDQADSKQAAEKQAAEKRAAQKPASDQPAAVTKVADDNSTRHQFAHASECVVSFGFFGHCDKNAPPEPPKTKTADAAPAPLDESTKGRFFHASKCVVTLGFGGRCDEK
jgi:hypothetical protein